MDGRNVAEDVMPSPKLIEASIYGSHLHRSIYSSKLVMLEVASNPDQFRWFKQLFCSSAGCLCKISLSDRYFYFLPRTSQTSPIHFYTALYLILHLNSCTQSSFIRWHIIYIILPKNQKSNLSNLPQLLVVVQKGEKTFDRSHLGLINAALWFTLNS